MKLKLITLALITLASAANAGELKHEPPTSAPPRASAQPAPDTKITLTYQQLKDLINSQIELAVANQKANEAAAPIQAQLGGKK
jgi:hypothetical protein